GAFADVVLGRQFPAKNLANLLLVVEPHVRRGARSKPQQSQDDDDDGNPQSTPLRLRLRLRLRFRLAGGGTTARRARLATRRRLSRRCRQVASTEQLVPVGTVSRVV